MSPKILPITEAREKLTELVDKASNQLQEYVITVRGRPKAVLMSSEEFESWKETMDILSDPGLVKAIREGEEEIKAGKVITLEELEKELSL